MKPIGLRFKSQKLDPYTGRVSGELMIVHQCTSCCRISSNRIAGDDNPQRILRLLEESRRPSRGIVDKLGNIGIKLLTQRDRQGILMTLFGHDYDKHPKRKIF